LEWQKTRLPSGYGRTFFRGQAEYTHRVAWITAYGEIPEGMIVLHRCDNPPCHNPEHLFLGTHADNSRDRDVKLRNGRRKLTSDQVRAIRFDPRPQTEIARSYGVDQSSISNIKNFKTWKWVA